MHDHEPQETSEESLAKGYEQEDISLPVIFRWAGYLIIFTVIVSAVVAGIYRLYVPNQPSRAGYTWDSAARQMNPNTPQIQALPMEDIKALRTEEYVKENQYAHWTDDDGKRVLRMKLSDAMHIIKQRGALPKAAPAPPMGTNAASATPATIDHMTMPRTAAPGTSPGETPATSAPMSAAPSGTTEAPESAGGQPGTPAPASGGSAPGTTAPLSSGNGRAPGQ